MALLNTLRKLCIVILVPVCLSGCEKEAVTGHWVIEEEGCLQLCTIQIYHDQIHDKDMLIFDNNNSEFARLVGGEFKNISGGQYKLIFKSGRRIGFTLKDGRLIAEEGSVFHRFAKLVGGEFKNISEGQYKLIFENGGSIGFTLKDGKLIAEEGSVFHRLVNL